MTAATWLRQDKVRDSDTQKTIKSFPFSTSPSLIMAIHLFYKSCSDSRICGCAREPFSHLSSLLFDCAWFGFTHHNAGRRILSANPSMPLQASGACARVTPTYFPYFLSGQARCSLPLQAGGAPALGTPHQRVGGTAPLIVVPFCRRIPRRVL